MEEKIIEAAISAIGTTFGTNAAAIGINQIKNWFDKASQSIDGIKKHQSTKIEDLAQKILKKDTPLLDTEITRRNLARWFEIPQEEFALTPTEHLEPEVLIRHLILEDLFKKRLLQWGYEVYVGEDLEGRESIDFTPDIYGKLNTLHGQFEVCVNFVCDNPPSQYRVRALLETLESYATDQSEFKWGDIYIS